MAWPRAPRTVQGALEPAGCLEVHSQGLQTLPFETEQGSLVPLGQAAGGTPPFLSALGSHQPRSRACSPASPTVSQERPAAQAAERLPPRL